MHVPLQSIFVLPVDLARAKNHVTRLGEPAVVEVWQEAAPGLCRLRIVSFISAVTPAAASRHAVV